MQVEVRNRDNVVILDLQGKLTLGEGELTLRDHVRDLLEKGHRFILVNMGNVRAVDSSGLGELIACRATCTRYDATLKLLNLQENISQIMKVSKLIGLFDVFDDEGKAVPSFQTN